MPVASTASVSRGRGRGRGRWAGDLNPSQGSKTKTSPSPTPVGSAGGGKSPRQWPSPRDSLVISPCPSVGSMNGETVPDQFAGPEDKEGTTPASDVCVRRVQSQSSLPARNGQAPLGPPSPGVQQPRIPDPGPRFTGELPRPPQVWVHRSQSQPSFPADSQDSRTATHVHSQRNPPQISPRPTKHAALSQSSKDLILKSLTSRNGETTRADRTQSPRPRHNGQVALPADSPPPQAPPHTSPTGDNPGVTTPPATGSRAQTPDRPLSRDGSQPSLNVWVQRAHARNVQLPNGRDDVTPPFTPRPGSKSPSPGQGRASSSSPRSQTASPSPRERGCEGELPPPPSPRGKDCSANSDSSADDAELEGLVGLPDRVLMFNKRDPVSILMEYGQTREVKVSFTEMSRSGPHHASRFHTAAIVDGETHVQATGTSKKNAKKAAAILALRTMYERGMAHLQQGNDTVNGEVRDMEREEGTSSVCHGTRVMHVSRRMLEVAEETQFINYSKDKVLATMVLERRGTYTVVGLGTGNRCIQYQNLPTDGSRVIHSHAEIIARRAFIRYMLKQLSSYRGSERHALFSRCRHTGLLRLHDDIRVHLYISRPPCGDAAAFPTITNFPNRMRAIRKQGQLRTIIDDGEGAIPTEFQLPANANGKERLRVMTCSDKILRWNAVGIQGALLSNFLNPIYLSSVVIGSHTGDQRGHVPRAVSGRLKCGRLHEVLMKPFRISSPEIVYPPHSDNYAITKSKQYCITWCEGDPDAEVIDAVSGAVAMEPNNDSPSSRVSKRTLLSLFRQASHTLRADHLASLTYTEAKVAARAYQRTKKSVEAHLQNCGFGQWLSLQQTYGVDNFREAEKLQQQQE
ncbi:double-stranded RNA-specific adenosine deaminase adr-2-like isoform X1 [Babylonia areolata]|uniref:double-stranded RNA-specific adenosine deaminase adr-2-like isoform X1 n=1 Tax=Babylonia areolata TaxID=304850 RepID=UPI003FD5E55F